MSHTTVGEDVNRRKLLHLIGGAGIVGVAGCIGDDEPADDIMPDDDDEEPPDDEPPEGPFEGGQLNLINSTVTSLDPIQSTDTASAIVINQAYQGLVNYPAGTTELQNQLLEEVDISDDAQEFTFTIKEGIEYHDGRELTAHDFHFNWRRLAESENSERADFILGAGGFLAAEFEADEDEGVGPWDVVPGSLGVEVEDDYTLTLRTRNPQPAALDILAYESFSAVPDGFVDDLTDVDGEYPHDEFSSEVMNGTGPFEFVEWDPGSEILMERFDDYWEEPAYLDSIHWRIIEDDDAMHTYAMEKNADIFNLATPFYDAGLIEEEYEDDQGRIHGTYGPHENDEVSNYLQVEELSTFYIGFNGANVPRPVRQAVAYVTDHWEMIDLVFEQRGAEAWSFTPPPMWLETLEEATAYEDWVDAWPYSPNETDFESAEQVLEDAGYTPDDPFELTLTTYDAEVFQEFGRLTRDKLEGTGIDMTLEEAEFSTLLSRGMEGDLEAYSLGWIWSWVDPAYGMFGFEPENTVTGDPMMAGETTGYYLDWPDTESEHMQKAQDAWERVEANPAPEDVSIRNEAYVEMEEAILDDMILLPLYHGIEERFWWDYVHVEPSGALGAHHQEHKDTWIDEEHH